MTLVWIWIKSSQNRDRINNNSSNREDKGIKKIFLEHLRICLDDFKESYKIVIRIKLFKILFI